VALSVGSAVSTTEFKDDVDGSPPWGALPTGPVASTTEVEEDIGGRPLVGVIGGFGSIHHRG
jgi:hypothetical protein